MSLGKRIRQRRAILGMTQTALAQAVSISKNAMSAIEADKVDPHLSLALLLCEALHLAPCTLLTATGCERPQRS